MINDNYTTDSQEKTRLIQEHLRALSQSKIMIHTNMGAMPILDYVEYVASMRFDSYEDMLMSAKALAEPSPDDTLKTPRVYQGCSIDIEALKKTSELKRPCKGRGR